MGSWSVYCGISNISIVSGQECVLLPLKKNNMHEGYLKYLPATMPIFGKYDDYGDIEKIEKNKNTELIENHFDCKIEDLTYFLTRRIITKENDFSKNLVDNEEIKDWKFMWIDRKVYDFMSNHNITKYGQHPYGKEEFLKFMGAEYIGNYPGLDKRYSHKWKLNDLEFESDGSSLQQEGKSIWYYNPKRLLRNISEELQEKLKLNSERLWSIYDEDYWAENYFWIIGVSGSSYAMAKRWQKYALDSNPDFKPKEIVLKLLSEKYVANFKEFGDYFADLIIIRNAMYMFSQIYNPYVLYVTPQCGEFAQHQKILDKFSEINKSYIDEEYDEEDDD
jgi:hypothetical protein